MAAAQVTTDPYENVRKRAVSQLYADPGMTIDAPSPMPVSSPDFKPSGTIESSPNEGIGPTSYGDPNQPAPQLGNMPVVLGDPSAPPPTAVPPPRVAVPPQPGMPTTPISAPGTMNYAQTYDQGNQPPYVAPVTSPPPQAGATAPTSQAPTVARTTLDTSTQNSSAGSAPNYDAINALYQKYLGRSASQDEAANWANGTYGASDLAGIEKQIAASGEATDYQKNHGGSPSSPSAGGPSSSDLAQSMLQRLNAPGQTMSASAMVDEFNAAYPQAKALYYNDSRGETIGFPDGYLAKTPSGWTWTLRGPEGAGGGTPGVSPPTPYTPPTGGPTVPSGTTPFQDEIRKQIMDRLKTAGMPVDEQSAGISDAVAGARDEATRAGEQERTALAERLYAQGGGGLDTNALTQQIQQSGEQTAQSTSGIRATLIMQEYTRKQNELDQLLSMATASGDAESARQIQIYQAQLQAQLQREGISADLAKYAAYLNQNTALAGLNG